MEFTINSDDAQAFFFRAMQRGWVAGGNYVDEMPFPGFKTFPYTEGGWYLTDIYHTTPNSIRSTGMTTIFWRHVPVWVMHYGGGYDELAIPTLKEALHWNYSQDKFVGGRGPLHFVHGKYTYVNDPRGSGGDFEYFEGSEFIDDTELHERVGSHWYRGQWLVEN